MADMEKDYTGKIVKIEFLNGDKAFTKTGIVYQQDKFKDWTRYTMLLSSGEEWHNFHGWPVTKISSVRMNEDLRIALKHLYHAKKEQAAFLDNFWKQKMVYQDKVNDALKAVREFSDELSYDDFRKEAEKIFRDRFPSTGGHDRECYFHCVSVSSDEITMAHILHVEKYAASDDYPFIRRRHDDTLYLDDNLPSFKQFCKRCAPAVISILQGKCKVGFDASIGDKATLTASRTYTFPLKKGLTKESLRMLEETVSGKEIDVKGTKLSLDAQISGATNKANGQKGNSKSKEPTR